MAWNYDVEDVPEGDARKFVTLEQQEMLWVGIRAFHHGEKRWYNGSEIETARIVAWQDLPSPADPKFFAIPSEITDSFERAMREEVIPAIENDIRDRADRAAETRNSLLFR